jgi:hypothetical protein
MPHFFSPKFLVLAGLGLLISGCPGKDFVEKRGEDKKADCLAYGGDWLEEADGSAMCSPEFEDAIRGTWLSECVERGSQGYVQTELTFDENSIQLSEFSYLSPSCDEIISASKANAKYFLSSRIFDGEIVPGQRKINVTSDQLDPFSDWKLVKIEEMKKLTILPTAIGFVKKIQD